LEECKYFNQTIIIDTVKLFPPLNYRNFINIYKGNNIPPPPLTIGIYTSAIWKRKREGIYFDDKVEKSERLIFSSVDEFISENPLVKAVVFFHPAEKRTSIDFEKAVFFYSSQVNNKKSFSFADRSLRTDNCFQETDIAVTPVSNTISERLFSGFKVLIVPFENQTFPILNSPFDLISAKTKLELKSKLKLFLSMNNEDYFKINNLNAYLYSSFDKV